MPIHAVALIRGRTIPEGLSGYALEDAALVRTAIRFDLEPDDLAAALVARLGDAFGDDARGVFVVPDVALDLAREHATFDAIVDGIGEAGMWVRRADVGETAEDRVLGRDAVIGEIFDGKPVSFAQLRELLGEQAGDDDDDDDDDVERTAIDGEDDDGTSTALDAPVDLEALMSSPALRGVIERLAATVAASPETQSELEQAASRGMDLESLASSPGIAQLMQSMMEELGKSPEAMQALFGQGGSDDDDE